MPSSKSTAGRLAWVLLWGMLLWGTLPAQAQSKDSSSMLPEPVRHKIEQLLKGAEEDLANGRLGGPGREGAVSKYQEVESLDPGNKAAYEGLKIIAERALELAQDALALGDPLQAAEFVETAALAGADPKKVAALGQKVKPALTDQKKSGQPAPDDKTTAKNQVQPEQAKDSPATTEPAESQGKSPAAEQTPAPVHSPTEPRQTTPVQGAEYERVLNGERHIRRALEALADGDREEARWNLEQAQRLIPDDPGLKRLEERIAALEQDSLRQAELKLDKAELLLNAGQILEAETLVDEAAAALGWGGRVAALKNRIREARPPQQTAPAPSGGGLTNTLGMKFNLIPAGRFMMGSPVESLTRPDELPYHEVVIAKPFWFGVAEVTQGQWEEVMGDNPSRFIDPKGLRPVEQVSFAEVMDFLNKLNTMDNKIHHRLPTEAEWEYACRAGTTSQYSYGDDPRELIKYGWYVGCAGFRTQPVGLKKANPWGFHDVHGNVWEICSDWYKADYYSKSPKQDPRGPEKGRYRVIRGGCFLDGPATLRSAHRTTFKKNMRTGFRVVAEMR